MLRNLNCRFIIRRTQLRVDGLRCLSTEITAEDIKKSADTVKRYKKFLQSTASAKTMTDAFRGADVGLYELPENPAEIATLTGMPVEHQSRTVLIQPRPLKTIQSGARLSHQWQITWKNSERWTNPLMGWTSTADPMSNTKLYFDSSDEAVSFAAKNGWKYEVSAPSHNVKLTPPGSVAYSDNFLPKKTMQEVREAGPKNKVFFNPNYGKSNWFMPLTFDGSAEVEQHGARN
eukprot:gene11856-24848_t